ncbi:MAG: hypothetical protein Q8T13_04935 [Acidobacteriota bacterium]|nr:hypothetical protein [Acidobacteriota bacterium]
MALVLVATPGAANANSYCTLAEANTYHESHPYASAWTGAATDDARNRALATATRLLDEHIEWDGAAADSVQALCWPRLGMLDRNENTIGSTTIPQALKNATAELARQLIAGDRTADSDIETQGISSLTAGPISLAFRPGVTAKVLPDAAWSMVKLWGSLLSRSNTIPLERV